MRNLYVVLVTIVAIVSLLGNYLLYHRYSSQRPLFTVNGQVIRQKDLDDRLDYMYAVPMLRQMIYTDLVLQEAQKEGVMPTEADIEREYDQINRTSPRLIVDQQKVDPTLALFKQGIRGQLALDNLRTKGVQVSDQEVEAYYQAHRAQFTLPTQASEIIVVAADEISAETAKRLLENNVKPGVIADTKGLRVIGINAQGAGLLPEAVGQQLINAKPGEIREVKYGNQYLIAKVHDISNQGVPSLDQIRPQVEQAVKLAKAPPDQKILNDLVERAHIVADSDKFRDAIPPAPGEQVAASSQ